MKYSPEDTEQILTVNYLKALNIDFFAVVNENKQSYSNRLQAMILANKSKKMGKIKGVSDLVVFFKNNILFLEMKKKKKLLKSGNYSKVDLQKVEQKDFEKTVNEYKYAVYKIAYGFEEAKKIIDFYNKK